MYYTGVAVLSRNVACGHQPTSKLLKPFIWDPSTFQYIGIADERLEFIDILPKRCVAWVEIYW